MDVKNLLLKGGVLFAVFLSAVVNAEGDNNKVNSVIPNKDLQEGEVVHVIKLEDILKGKYSKDKAVVKKADKEKEPVKEKENSSVVKPVASSNDIDMDAAFNAVMGYPNEPESPPKAKQEQIAKPALKMPTPKANVKSAGWLYLGKFSRGQWDQPNNQVLGLGATLPKVGQGYSVRVFSNVRQGYPSKKGMPPIVKVLPQGSKIKLLDIHNSGKSGHYWAKVQWL